ncbi:MAG TPA: hypothetical protein VGG50_22830 [Streptosporangiaceae bacterium]
MATVEAVATGLARTGIAIVLAATVIRGLLVPAFMRLAGQANWWSPPVLHRLYQRIGLAETGPGRRPARRQHPGRPWSTMAAVAP